MKVNDEDFCRWFDEARSIFDVSGVGEPPGIDAQQTQEYVSGVMNTIEDSRGPIGEIIALIQMIDASQVILIALWNHCRLLDEAGVESVGPESSEIYQELFQRFLMFCNDRIRTLARDIEPGCGSEWCELLARTMRLTRLCARWYWLRYERPPAMLWTFAAYLFELWESVHDSNKLSLEEGQNEPDALIQKNYTGLLFIQWIAPSSLSSIAYFLVEDLVDRCIGEIELVIGRVPKAHEIVDLDTGEIILTRDVSNFCRKNRLRYFPLPALRVHVAGAITRMDSSQTVCVVRDAIEQLSRTVIGHQARHLVRFGNRTSIVRTVHICHGYTEVVESYTNSSSGKCPAMKAFVRDRSISGVRLFVSGIDLKIGMLLRLDGAFSNEHSLGIVRWLSRARESGWNAGILLLRGSISIFEARLDFGVWPSGNKVAPILIIDEERGASDGVLVVLPKDPSKMQYKQLILDDCGLMLRINTHVESGRDFDLERFYFEEMA